MPIRRSRQSDLLWGAAVFIGVFGAALLVLSNGAAPAAIRPLAAPGSGPGGPYAIVEPLLVREVRFLVRPPPDQHFRNCSQARAARRQNIPSHDPSYRVWMDGDRDGLACEPDRILRRY